MRTKAKDSLELKIIAESEFPSVPIMFGANHNPVILIFEKKQGQWLLRVKLPWGASYEEPFSNEREARAYYNRYSRALSKGARIFIDDPRFPQILG